MTLPSEPPDYNLYLAGGRTFIPPEVPFIEPGVEPVYFIVQFRKPLTLEERKQIQSQYELRFDRYILNFAFLERLGFEKWEALSQEPLYRAIERYKPEYKISPGLNTPKPWRKRRKQAGLPIRAVVFEETANETIDRIINFIILVIREDPVRSSHRRLPEVKKLDNRDLGGDVQLLFHAPSPNVLPKIAEIEEVQWIEEFIKPKLDSSPDVRTIDVSTDRCPQQNSVAGTIQSGHPGVTPIWQSGLNGNGQTIGILDDYAPDIRHCMFRDKTGIPVGMSHRKVVGLRNPSGLIREHATLVAGIAAGDQLCLLGMAENRGIAFAAKLSVDDLMNIKNGNESVLDVFSRQRQDGAVVHSNSWHEDDTGYNQTAKNVDTFVHLNEDHVVCGSAGNRRARETLGPPGTAKNALCVCAGGEHPNHLEHEDGLADRLNDRRRKPDIGAPGCGINSARIDTDCLCSSPRCASSWSTPVMSGAAALVRHYYLDGFYPEGVRNLARPHHPSAALVKATLLNSAVIMESAQEYPNGRTGWGLIQLNNALFLAGARRRLFMADVRNASGLGTGQSRTYNIQVRSNSQTLKITLIWTDPPSQAATARFLVNDLDLLVTSPGNARLFRGNANFVNGFSQPQANPIPDDPNNVEIVIIQQPAPGDWTVTVFAKAVNVGRQGFALVVTGDLSDVNFAGQIS